MEREKKECFGCKTHFQEKSKLPLEGLSIELKNYPIPLKDQKHRWILLKTICSFLNSKGGTIFIGADDSTGEVRGIQIERKEQDDFKLFIQQLTTRIHPKVDLSDREDIIVQFIPVLEKEKFMGKYLIKIIVKQGELSELYCFSQKVQLQAAGDKKIEELEVVYAYVRNNMGNIKEYTGYELVLEAKNKVKNPSKIANCFHDDCNPEPVNLSVEIKKIGFSKIPNVTLRENLKEWFEWYLNDIKITEYLISYDEENDMIAVEFEKKAEFQKCEEFIAKNISELNKYLEDTCFFEKKGVYLDCISYENTKVVQNNNKVENKNEKKSNYKDKNLEVPNFSSDENSLRNSREKKEDKPKESKETEEKSNNEQKGGRKYGITFTHINTKTRSNLVNFLQSLTEEKKLIEEYENTVEVFLKNQKKFIEFSDAVFMNYESLIPLGFKNEIKLGLNTGNIEIQNFDRRVARNLEKLLVSLMGKDLKSLEVKNYGNRCVLLLKMSTKQTACEWLDKLLVNKQVKEFKIPGAERGQSAQMKFILVCQDFELI